MDFSTYQERAKTTIQKNASDPTFDEIVPFLGIIGEIGSVVTQLKIKIRDGKGYIVYKNKLGEELGDVLWYLSTIATQNGLNLDDVAEHNLAKTHDQFLGDDPSEYKNFDLNYPADERFPDEFEIEFKGFSEEGKNKLILIDKRDNSPIGDPLTDNTYDDDGYRFHDIFHFGYLAVLG